MSQPYVKSKAGWRHIGDTPKYYRSMYEANYARYLQFLQDTKAILNWQHEPQTFWFPEIKRGVCSYLPDFRILRPDGSIYFAEVKGYMDSRSRTKLKRLKQFYPETEIYLIDAAWFKAYGPKLRLFVPGWEKGDCSSPKRLIRVKKKVYV